MPNVPYWTEGDPGDEAVAADIRKRRGGKLLNLDRILLHSPPIAGGWSTFFGQVRSSTALSPYHRELAMCAVATLNGADYEFHHHRPLLAEGGASAAQIEALHDVEAAMENAALFDAPARALLRFVFESTRQVTISPATMDAVREAFPNPRALVELIVITAAYNMVSRILAATAIEVET